MSKVTVTVNLQTLKDQVINGEIKAHGARDLKHFVEYKLHTDAGDTEYEVNPEGWDYQRVDWRRCEDTVLIFKDGELNSLGAEYELSNPCIFKGILMLPGRDSVTLIELETGELKKKAIR